MASPDPRALAASGVARFRRLATLPFALFTVGLGWVIFNHLFEPSIRDRIPLPEVLDELVLVGLVSGAALLMQLSRSAAESSRALLSAAVESASGSVIVSAPDGSIRYVNPAFERATGYTDAEVRGRHPREFLAGRGDPSTWVEMRDALAAHGAWVGEWTLRTKDGGILREEAAISAVRDGQARISGFVSVTRNITRERETEESLDREIRERAAVSAALARLQPADSAEATAEAICREILALEGLDHAAVVEFRGPHDALVLARMGGPGWPVEAGGHLPARRAAYLHERARHGGWSEPWVPRPEDGRYGELGARTGVAALAYAPIRNGDGLLGVVIIGTHEQDRLGWLLNQTGVAVEFAATASALLAGWLEADRRAIRERARLETLVARKRFSPVFQPIVALRDGEVVGYEALTRFLDGCRPDSCFRSAWSVGVGAELELATLQGALDAARVLPAGRWLDLNVSPRLVLEETDRLAALLRDADREVVLEITEHDLVEDYRALRAAIVSLGPRPRVAVDDAGAGVANFRHIVELKPDLVKLDADLVRGIDADLGRQALVVGMRHFARASACRLIAEGVEQGVEAAALADLGIEFAQGYWFGRPAPADQLLELGQPRLSHVARVAPRRLSPDPAWGS